MTLKDIMKYKSFCVVGDTINNEKKAYEIKHELLKNNYNVVCVGKELPSLNDTKDIDVIDLCIHPAKGINLLKEYKLKPKAVLIQPGAQSEEIINFLIENNIPYLEGCALIGLTL